MIKIDQELVPVVPMGPPADFIWANYIPVFVKSNEEQNREFLLKVILGQLGLTDEDLERDPSCIKDIVRESNIDKV